MRIKRLEIRNFKQFSDYTLDLHPQFTLLVGDNGTGKTSLLDALAIAAGIWLVNPPDTTLINSKRNILPSEIRLEAIESSGITQFAERKPVQIKAIGQLGEQEQVQWTRKIDIGGARTSNTEAKAVLDMISRRFKQDQAGERLWFPVIAYYGAGRAWLPAQKAIKAKRNNGVSRRWQAFYGCLEERVRIADLQTWFQNEALAALENNGQMRLSFQVVKYAILHCIPNANDLSFKSDRAEVVISLDHHPIPFSNLSAGQKMMVALIADIAIKIVNQNAKFLSEETNNSSQELPLVLQKTPGLVLIDEIDVHLHPKWQRRVVNDLTQTFPNIQFVCTTHSPQVMGQIRAEHLRLLNWRHDHSPNIAERPTQTLGMDSSWILQNVMGASARDPETAQKLDAIFDCIDEAIYPKARQMIAELIVEKEVAHSPDIQEVSSLLDRLELLEDYEAD